jgi:hypothetical protein
MAKNELVGKVMEIGEKVFNQDEMLEAAGSSLAVILVGETVNTVAKIFFNTDLDPFTSIYHLAVNVGIGMYTYKRAGGGIKGLMAAAVVAGLVNGAWEMLEQKMPAYREESIDKIVDWAVNYAGVVCYPIVTKVKSYLDHRKGKWVI